MASWRSMTKISVRIQDPDLDPDPNPDLNPDLNPDQDPLVRGMDLRIRIHTEMSWIRNTAFSVSIFLFTICTFLITDPCAAPFWAVLHPILCCAVPLWAAQLCCKHCIYVHCIWMEQFSKAKDEMGGLHHTVSLAACLPSHWGGSNVCLHTYKFAFSRLP